MRLILYFLIFNGILNVLYAQTYPPSCVLTMPYNNAYFKAGANVEIVVYASDIGKTSNNGTISKVEFYNGTILLGEETMHTNYSYKYVWNCVAEGTYTIHAKATNNKGVSFTSTGVIITVGSNNVTQNGMSACKGKYLANVIAKSPGINYNSYWNGVTAESACKWGSVENIRNTFNWGGANTSYNHAKDNNLIFRYNAVVFASQYPAWLLLIGTDQAKIELVEYMTAIASNFPLADQIDVLNDQLGNHQAANQQFRNLFGGGTNVSPTDFTWQIWLFQQARQLFPNSKLILNDYTLENDTNALAVQLSLLKELRDRGLVDGLGTQAHSLYIDGISIDTLKKSLDKMATAGVPIYVTEFNLKGTQPEESNDTAQLHSYQKHFPVYWKHPAVAGISLSNYVSEATWIRGTGLVSSNGTERPAMTWLKSYINDQNSVGYPTCATANCVATGIDNNADFNQTTVFPNPFSDKITISAKGNFSYQIMNSTGQLLESGNSTDKIILGHGYPKGMYLLRVNQGVNSKKSKLLKE